MGYFERCVLIHRGVKEGRLKLNGANLPPVKCKVQASV
jgi:hypothetical protein